MSANPWSARRHSLAVLVRTLALPTLLVIMALVAVFAVELAIRLQVTVSDLVRVQDSGLSVSKTSLQEVVSTLLERARAAKSLSSDIANALALTSLLGAIGFLLFGTTTKLVRTLCFLVVVLAVARAYFWSVQ